MGPEAVGILRIILSSLRRASQIVTPSSAHPLLHPPLPVPLLRPLPVRRVPIRAVRIHLPSAPARQRHRQYQIVVRPFPPYPELRVPRRRYLRPHLRHLFHQSRAVRDPRRSLQPAALQAERQRRCRDQQAAQD